MCENCNTDFVGTKEQKERLATYIKKHKKVEGGIIAIMQEAQNIYGYLPQEVQEDISSEAGVPFAKIYGIATFYSQFYLEKKGDFHISICMGTACYVKGSGDIMSAFRRKLGIKGDETSEDGRFSIEATRCIGACGLAPVLTVNDDVHGRLSADDVDKIIEQYKNKEV